MIPQPHRGHGYKLLVHKRVLWYISGSSVQAKVILWQCFSQNSWPHAALIVTTYSFLPYCFIKASVTPYRIGLTDVRRRTQFSIRSCPSTCVSCPLFIRRCPFLIQQMRSLSGEVHSIRRKVLCLLKTWNRLHWKKKAPAGCMVAMHCHAFLVL